MDRTLRLLCLCLCLAPVSSACNLSRMAGKAIQESAQHDGLTEHRAVFGGRQVRYWMGGSGPPLLMVHGFGGDGLTTWARQLRPLSATHTLIVPDLLWFGQSSALGVQPGLRAQVRTLIDLLDQLQIDRVDIVGISYGGFVTLLMAQDHPERLKRTVIVDSPGPVFDAADQQAMNQRLGATSPADVFVPQTTADVARLISLVRPGGPKIPPFLLRDIQKAHFMRNQDAHRALLADLLTLQDAFPPDARRVPADALVIWGSEDPVFPLSEGQQLATALGAPLEVIEGAAHGPNFQEAAAFNRVLLRFLDGPSTAAVEPASD